jgi:glycosyltransferase involved in cell wall biosynthesis
MNVLLSAYACLPDAGTEPGHGWNWALSLSQRGMNVTVITRIEAYKRVESYLVKKPIPNVTFVYVKVPVRALKTGTVLHYCLWHWGALKAGRRLQEKMRFDVVHHVTYGSIHVPSQLWRLGLPTVFGPLGGGQTAPFRMLSYFGRSGVSELFRTMLTKSLAYSPWHRRWIREMSLVIASNHETQRVVERFGYGRVERGFDVAVPASFLSSHPRRFTTRSEVTRLLWVGRIIPRKGLAIALDALASVRCRSSLTIVGEAPDESEIRRAIEKRGLTGRIQWTGKRWAWSDVRAAYLEHDALLFTSLRESCGAQLLEAMALGLPIITLNLHGARDLVPDNASIKVAVMRPRQVVRDLAAAVDRFAVLGPAEKERMSTSALECAAEHTWEKRSGAAVRLYQRLVAAG